jgi:dTDP-4-amino-4,6-dideoxygalactose transaminase
MRARYDYVVPGLNWRLSDLHAAVGIGQLESLNDFTERRQKNAALFDLVLGDVPWITTPPRPAGRTPVYHLYTIAIAPDAPLTRDDLQGVFDRAGIDSGVVYPRVVYDYQCFRTHPNVAADHVPRAEAAARAVLSLPVHPRVTEADIARVADVFRTVGKRAA